jgi:hypothetical protein
MQGVPPEEKRSQGPAATREPVATRPRASTQVRSTLVRENMSDYFWGSNEGSGTTVSVLLFDKKQNGYIVAFKAARCLTCLVPIF